MLDSKQLIEITGISRATLNNYVAQGILPHPVIRTPTGPGSRATRLGYFEDDAVQIIERVQELKKEGLTMAEIAARIGTRGPQSSADFGASFSTAAVDVTPLRSRSGGQGALANLSLEPSIENFPGPAYMVNNNLELIWWNDEARQSFFGFEDDLPGELESRNLLKLLFRTPLAGDLEHMRELLRPHLAAGKKRLSHQALIRSYSAMSADQLSVLRELYEQVKPLGNEPMAHFPVNLPASMGHSGEPLICDLYVCFYREGILFTHSPVQLDNDFLLDFLRKRNHVIHELLKKRKPYLTPVTVMVADLQSSARICAELPAEEYFELINNIWQESEPIYRKYYGTHGKHAGDGMVYYFFPQPDCDYRLNAIACALELCSMMRRLTLAWQSRKGWFSDLYLNIGLNEGQEWFGSYHAGGHVEFTVLGETINYASRISDFARHGSVWATKSMLSQIPADCRRDINFGITRRTHNDEPMFVTDTYANLGSLLHEDQMGNGKFQDVKMLPVTEIRAFDN